MFFPDDAVRAGNHFRGGVTARHKRTAVRRYGDVPILLKTAVIRNTWICSFFKKSEGDEFALRIRTQESNNSDARQLADYFRQVRKRLSEFDFKRKPMLIEAFGVKVFFNRDHKIYKVTWRFDPKMARLTNQDQELAECQATSIRGVATLDSTSTLTT